MLRIDRKLVLILGNADNVFWMQMQRSMIKINKISK